MWCHVVVHPVSALFSARFWGSIGLLAAACALAVSGVAAAATEATPPGPSVSFPSARGSLVGSQAVVPVKCVGPEASTCSGTLTLTTNGNKHKVPFAMIGGSSQSLTVPLGTDSTTVRRAFAVALTAQESGAYLRSSGVLRLRGNRH